MFHKPSGCFRIEPLQAIAYEHDDDHYDTFEEAVAAAKEKLPKYDDAYGIYSYCGGEHTELIAVVSNDFRHENIDEPQVFLKQGLAEDRLRPPAAQEQTASGGGRE